MQIQSTRMYRVKAVAELLDVHVATVYREIEAGKLAAVRIGSAGKRAAVRVPGTALADYLTELGVPVQTSAEVA